MATQFIKDIFIYGIGNSLLKLLTFFVFLVYANVLTIEEFGIFSLITSLANFVIIFLSIGMSNSVQRYYLDTSEIPVSQRPLLVSTALWITSVWSIVLTCAAVLILSPFQGWIFHKYQLPWLLILLGLANNIPTQIIQLFSDTLRIHFRPWRYAGFTLVSTVLGYGIGLFLVLKLDLKIQGILVGSLLGGLMSIPIGFWSVKKDIGFHWNSSIAKKILHFGSPFVLAGIASWMVVPLNQWLLATFRGNQEVGLYNVAFNFSNILNFFISAFAIAWGPYILKAYAENPNYKLIVSRALSYWAFLLIAFASLLILFCQEILQLTTPRAFWGALTPTIFLLISNVFLGTTQITALGITFARKTHLISISAWISAIANFILNVLLTPQWGAVGASIATCIASAVLTCAYLYCSQRLNPISFQYDHLIFLSLTICSIAICALVLKTYPHSLALISTKLFLWMLIIAGGFVYRVVTPKQIKNLILGRVV
ncbi:MAG: oligosaccharide flippase family protein [Candidatus Omnitrophota bacterium]|nr:oligosaccharide flippase family protein [Candidatus Omnitrophota bacterium]MDZ4241552.1 oligosaccharide flippase family protein [Candidatus Omnitrophota bacterium]